MTTQDKLADALRDIQQYLQMTAPSPDCGHLLQITVDALAEHDAHEVEKAKPDGDYVLVPRVPTQKMVVSGFESEPDEFFSSAEEWDRYEAMSGCQQAAHKARLCWAAMLSAAPAQPPAPEPQGDRDIEQRARELLALEYERVGSTRIGEELRTLRLENMRDKEIARAVRAIIAALQQPQGATNETRVTDEAQSEKWIPVKPHGAPYYGIHTESGATIAGTASGLGERDAKHICALHNGELCEADDLIRALGLEPERFRTECGFINHHKLAAAIKHPDAYTGLALKAAPQPAEPVAVDALLKRAYEVVHHDQDCPSIGGNGDNDCRCDAVPFLRDLEKFIAARLAQPATIHALDVFKIAGGDVECSPEPTAEMALDCLRDLRQCYEEVLSQQPAAALPEVTDADVAAACEHFDVWHAIVKGDKCDTSGRMLAALKSYRARLMGEGK